MDTLPRVGDRIYSGTKHYVDAPVGGSEQPELGTRREYRVLELEVVAITHVPVHGPQRHEAAGWTTEVELHLPRNGRWDNITHFDIWYDWICGEHYETYQRRLQRYQDQKRAEAEKARERDEERHFAKLRRQLIAEGHIKEPVDHAPFFNSFLPNACSAAG
ncbi:MAG TPA: hypothetical protein VM493_01285 [Vicinamibacterales bacterium]|nr:hypothetical protein [Vicinamibacterales bacterium]